ncbi:hypothetical protein H6P81_010726 [Aristolochia fimbriata]|uniref:Pectinesterase inhibitor domain-containing protein n=1 Tax=Aristolochia fimbriata TaxID=158543 RepID=A0AAV7ESD1_ARIFI|nr:hypothetical protein H6P81_010726 [Aristolochia fimbriata]
MATLALTHVVVVFFFFFFFFFSIAGSTGSISLHDAQLIQTVCSYTSEYKDLCVSSLSARAESRTANITGLMIIALDIAFKNGMNNFLDLVDFAKVMADCRDRYDKTTDAILDAGQYSEAKNLREAIFSISTAMTYVQQCGDDLRKLKGSSPSFSIETNEKQLALLNIAEVIMTQALQ